MANWNPLTNAVGGNGATQANAYYNAPLTNFGEYGFIFLKDIIDNFTATYTGQGKILANVLGGDIHFHAHRALQELSYDTLVSSKSQEIEVCPSLKMPLPHDYVNYTKLVSVDANGIEHIIYPARNTSHPFAISQTDGCTYDMAPRGDLLHQEECEDGTEVACDLKVVTDFFIRLINNSSLSVYEYYQANGMPPPSMSYDGDVMVTFPDGTLDIEGVTYTGLDSVFDVYNAMQTVIDDFCLCAASAGAPVCGTQLPWVQQDFDLGEFWWSSVPFGGGWSNLNYDGKISVNFVLNLPNALTGTTNATCTPTSNAWSNYSGASGTSLGLSDPLNPSSDNSNYFLNEGQRYGIDPQYAHANGSYFIDHMRGNIHFSSALAGKTIILKYISDGHGTDDEMMIPKMAEEAMYKWIAYGCAQARTDVDQGTIARLKKEKIAETRKAKLRLSNIKLEEITQVMRGKSKWIKH
tara:strand:- start:3325 stop:4719 length:1395 start_codon:yes stop_codon:yes gene_type:complete